jgi:hypothetical protein
LKGKLYLQSSSDDHSMVFDGKTWTQGPAVARVASHSAQFAGKLVLLGQQNLLIFDGEHPAAPALSNCQIAALFVSGTSIYVLCERDSTIRRSTDLLTWSTIAKSPKNACSLAVLKNKLYVGTRDSQLYRLSRGIQDERLMEGKQ